MDYSAITYITIPEGAVTHIHQAGTLLWKRQGLPSGYQQLAYIETSGSQYIDTEVMASNYPEGLSYKFRGQFYGFKQSSGNNYLFGCLNSGKRSGNICADTRASANPLSLFIGASGSQIFGAEAPTAGTDFELTLTCVSTDPDNAVPALNGTPFTYVTSGAGCPMPEATIYLLHCSGVGSTSKPFWGRLYSFSISTPNGTPIRAFVPCCRISDNAIGLYDTVEGKFYTNAGTGSFM